jgi:phosphatidate cytidylyltransferase
MSPLDAASIVLIVGPAIGLAGAAIYAVARRGATSGLRPRTALARAASYAGLAAVMLIAARFGVPGFAILFGAVGAAALIEWQVLFDLPVHHRIGMVAADVVIILAIAIGGVAAADWLVGGLVLVGALWPVVRADTGRAIRDLGMAAVGVVLIPVLLAHGVALAVEHGDAGAALVVAIAVACATSDIGAYLVGRRFGHTALAPRLSPNKTRAGAVGNLLGAAVGIAVFAPALVPAFGVEFVLALVPLVAAGALWGDLLESAAKREAGVKDAGAWLPGFGGILDRIDSFLVTVALAYWIARLWGAG